MKRQCISLEEIADYNNLILALHKSAKGKRQRKLVQQFIQHSDDKLSALGRDILSEKLPYGRFQSFQIYDPKKRLIHAACFEDRVFHHAIMNIAGPRLEKAMFYHSYACRPEKGVHKAVQQVQTNLQHYNWFVKIDISAYFSCINHRKLLNVLQTCFKGKVFASQLNRIIKSCPDMPEKGLPIGSLTSQYFANYYLDGLDRFLANDSFVKANIRYMDDVIWWCDSKKNAKQVLVSVISYLQKERLLRIKPSIQILPSQAGVSYCGFRISQASMRLSRRRKRNFIQRRNYWEQQYLQGNITGLQLQTAYAAVHAISQDTDSLAWRQKQLREKPPVNV